MILIQGGRVIDPEKQEERIGDVIIEGGRIRAVGTFPDTGDYEKVIRAFGCVVAPGLVDIHVHFRDPGSVRVWPTRNRRWTIRRLSGMS